MDVVYTDVDRIEQGVLKEFEIDFDATNQMDFQITTGIKNNVLKGGAYWYIEGTEYGGKIDTIKTIADSNTIQYTGRNVRGLLCSKIVEPPVGNDYLVLSGTLQEVITKLISVAGYDDLFEIDKSNIMVSNYKVNRYITLYDAIVRLMGVYGRIPKFTFQDRKVHVSVYESIDYTNENEYSQDDLRFTITKVYANVNHLICLGQGELKDRTVLHLYTDDEGNIGTVQTIVGEQEVVEIYENTNCESVDELTNEGIKRLNELKNKDSFEVTVPNIDLNIGDIIGGWEVNSGTYVAKEIVNIIAQINDNSVELEYKVGEDDTTGKQSNSTSVGSSSNTYVLPPATKNSLGGVIIGDGINVDISGKISVKQITVDAALSATSTNPVQNKVVTEELREVFQSVSNGKMAIAAAITDKGVETAADATFSIMVENIGKIYQNAGIGIYIPSVFGRIGNVGFAIYEE